MKPASTSPDVSSPERVAPAGSCTNLPRSDGAAVSRVEGREEPVSTRSPGHKPAMQEDTSQMMEEAVGASNWEAALGAVERNAGAPGPDGMKTRELREHLALHGEGIKAKLLKGSFKPSAARRKEIPKPNGGTRPLSIPNVLDRFIQQLLLQVMTPLFEPIFSESSHGFRPGRSAHGAIQAAQEHAREGKEWVVDMDITQFFDRVNHDILMTQVSRVVKDKRVLQMIGRFLRAGVILPEGCCVRSKEGTPQGGPLSPLLANIYLDKLDRELERRGYKHVRYADDCNIYVGSQQAAERAMEVISGWISRHLRLQINVSKSGIGRVWERKFLGFILTMTLFIGISPQAIARYEDRVRTLWNARQPLSSNQLRDQWSQYMRGWWGYYGKAEDKRSILDRSGWIRRHIRKCFWQRWHSARGRRSSMARLGASPRLQRVASSSRGAWLMGNNPAVRAVLSNRVLKHYGFITPSDLNLAG